MIEWIFFFTGGILGFLIGGLVGYYYGVIDEMRGHVSKYFKIGGG